MLIFKPFKLVISLFVSIAVLYFVFFVRLGDRTMWEHIRAIAGTREAQDLGKGMKQTGEQVINRASQELGKGIPAPAVDAGAPSTSRHHHRH